jgi:hypothetical protein
MSLAPNKTVTMNDIPVFKMGSMPKMGMLWRVWTALPTQVTC